MSTRKQLEKARADLAAILADKAAQSADVANWTTKAEKVADEIAALEKTLADNPGDLASITKLAALRDQAKMLASKLAAVTESPALHDQKNVRLAAAIHAARGPVCAAMQPVVDELIGKVTESMRPFFHDAERARFMAEKTDALADLRNFLATVAVPGLGDPAIPAVRLVTILDELLAGRSVWQWPKP